ncbi:MAG: hypothetical protein V4471_07280 [Pseudomonadota bacterium]
MKLKQALVLGLTTAVLAIPALAADEATNATSLPSVNAEQNAAVITPAKKDAFHKKGPKDSNDSLATKKADDLSKLSTVNPNEPAKN